MTTTTYVIDACALIDANKLYSRRVKIFEPIWKRIGEMLENGQLVSSIEIFEELKDKDLVEWIKSYKDAFIPLDEDIQRITTDILRQYPNILNLKKGKKGNSNGDPFLIATAQMVNGVVVTNEKPLADNASELKIPNVCNKLQIPSMDLTAFIETIMK